MVSVVMLSDVMQNVVAPVFETLEKIESLSANKKYEKQIN
jgi:hypothetical protein